MGELYDGIRTFNHWVYLIRPTGNRTYNSLVYFASPYWDSNLQPLDLFGSPYQDYDIWLSPRGPGFNSRRGIYCGDNFQRIRASKL